MQSGRILVLATALLCAAPLAARDASPLTPAIGSADRTALLDALRTHPDMRFTFRHLRLWRDGDRAIAYVEGDNGVIGGFKSILTREGRTGWRTVWAEGDGGSDSCRAGARHYGWAIELIGSYRIAPDRLFPGVTRQARDLERAAKRNPELQCVGDLEGGPE